MSCYRRGRLAFDAFRNLSSRIVTRASIQEPTSRILQYGSSNAAKFSGFSSYSCFSKRLGFSVGTSNNYCNSAFGIGRRYYYVDRYRVQHFRPRGPRKWLQNPRNLMIVVLVGSGFVITLYFGNLETVPYAKRTHFVLLSKDMEKRIGESQFQQMKASYKGKILPAIHPDSVRVRLISKDIIEALQRGLSHETVWSDMGYASSETDAVQEGRAHDTLMALTEGGEGKFEGKWSKDDEILDDKWVQLTRKKGQEKGLQSATSHLDGLNWEVLVVNEPVVNAFCLPGGKIVVFTGLLEHFRTDVIATIIGHEMEMEADYIGLLLVASAGYDPRVAPKVYEKLDQISGDNSGLKDYLSTHPSGRKRAQLLAQAKVMEEALSIYREIRSGYGVEGFL